MGSNESDGKADGSIKVTHCYEMMMMMMMVMIIIIIIARKPS